MSTNWAEHTERVVATNGVDLHVTEAGDGFPVIFAHGFPELGYSWRHQLPALAGAGYRAVAPDQRGYGRSSRPEAVEDYDIVHLTDDLIGILDDLGSERGVFVGHDWGAMVVWTLSLLAPERVAGVVGMSVPFVPRPPAPPIQILRERLKGMFFYMVYFQEPGVADADLDGDPAMTLRRMLSGLDTSEKLDAGMLADDGRGFVERLAEPDPLPDWLPQDELDHYIGEFSRTGFTGALNWYRNMDRNWHLTEKVAGAKVEVPALFIGGQYDPVLLMTPPSIMEGWVEDLRGSVIVDGASHWVQHQNAAEVNVALLEFISGLDLA